MLSFLVRIFALLAAISTFGLTILDIMKDHLGYDTAGLLRDTGTAMGIMVADAAEWWGRILASVNLGDGGGAFDKSAPGGDAGVATQSAPSARMGPGDGRANPLVQWVVVAITFVAMYGLIRAIFGRRAA